MTMPVMHIYSTHQETARHRRAIGCTVLRLAGLIAVASWIANHPMPTFGFGVVFLIGFPLYMFIGVLASDRRPAS